MNVSAMEDMGTHGLAHRHNDIIIVMNSSIFDEIVTHDDAQRTRLQWISMKCIERSVDVRGIRFINRSEVWQRSQ